MFVPTIVPLAVQARPPPPILAPPYHYTSLGGRHDPPSSFHTAYADTSTGELFITAWNYLISGDAWDFANAYAKLFKEFTVSTTGSKIIDYSYAINGLINSGLAQCLVRLKIFVQRWTGWWIFWSWQTVTEHVILEYWSTYRVVSESGSGSFVLNPPGTGSYRVAAELYGIAPANALGGVYFSGSGRYARVSLRI